MSGHDLEAHRTLYASVESGRLDPAQVEALLVIDNMEEFVMGKDNTGGCRRSNRRYQVVVAWRDVNNRRRSKTVTVWAGSVRDAEIAAVAKADRLSAETTVTPL